MFSGGFRAASICKMRSRRDDARLKEAAPNLSSLDAAARGHRGFVYRAVGSALDGTGSRRGISRMPAFWAWPSEVDDEG